MARARNIKPGFFQNEQLGELQPIERLCFIGMWTIADYRGCIEFRAKRIKIQLLPYDDCCVEKIAINLERSGLIAMYSVNGHQYIKILNFVKHQNPHKNERDAGSLIPDIDQDDKTFIEKRSEFIELESIENNRDKTRLNPEEDGCARAESFFPLPETLLLNPEVSATPLVIDNDRTGVHDDKKNCPILKIIDLYHEILPELRRVEVISEQRKTATRARWNQHKTMQSLERWREYFMYVRDSDFLMGKTDPLNGKKQFSADFDFLTTASKFVNVIEGKYHDKR